MRSLYEIDKSIEQCIIDGTDFETGEFVAFDELNELQMERDQKIEGVALYVKDARAEAAAIKAEITVLKARMDKLNRNADGASEWIASALNGSKFSTSKVDCTFRRSEAVETDEEFCQWAYGVGMYDLITHKESDEPNKAKIKAFLKNGGELEHCSLVNKNNLTIK
jgi:hypothetical protein